MLSSVGAENAALKIAPPRYITVRNKKKASHPNSHGWLALQSVTGYFSAPKLPPNGHFDKHLLTTSLNTERIKTCRQIPVIKGP